jgi:hypothetical protein
MQRVLGFSLGLAHPARGSGFEWAPLGERALHDRNLPQTPGLRNLEPERGP